MDKIAHVTASCRKRIDKLRQSPQPSDQHGVKHVFSSLLSVWPGESKVTSYHLHPKILYRDGVESSLRAHTRGNPGRGGWASCFSENFWDEQYPSILPLLSTFPSLPGPQVKKGTRWIPSLSLFNSTNSGILSGPEWFLQPYCSYGVKCLWIPFSDEKAEWSSKGMTALQKTLSRFMEEQVPGSWGCFPWPWPMGHPAPNTADKVGEQIVICLQEPETLTNLLPTPNLKQRGINNLRYFSPVEVDFLLTKDIQVSE